MIQGSPSGVEDILVRQLFCVSSQRLTNRAPTARVFTCVSIFYHFLLARLLLLPLIPLLHTLCSSLCLKVCTVTSNAILSLHHIESLSRSTSYPPSLLILCYRAGHPLSLLVPMSICFLFYILLCHILQLPCLFMLYRYTTSVRVSETEPTFLS